MQAQLVLYALVLGLCVLFLLGTRVVRVLIDHTAEHIHRRLPLLEHRVLFNIQLLLHTLLLSVFPHQRLLLFLYPSHDLLDLVPRVTPVQFFSVDQHLRYSCLLEQSLL